VTSEQEVEHDYSMIPVMGALFVDAVAHGNAPLQAKALVLREMEAARLAAWGELLPHLADYYPATTARNDLVKLQIVAPAEGNGAPGAFVATNSSDQPLTAVVLSIDLFHFSKPGQIARQYYFVPHWNAGESLYFAPEYRPNVSTDGRRHHGNGGGSAPEADRWLGGIGGVLKATVKVWSKEALQPEQTVSFDANAEAVGEWELDTAKEKLERAVRHPPKVNPGSPREPAARHPPNKAKPAPHRATTPTSPAGDLLMPPPVPQTLSADILRDAKSTAERVLTYVPQDSQAARDAQALASNPDTAMRERCKRRVSDLLDALPEAQPLSGAVWAVYFTRTGMSAPGLDWASDPRAAAARPHGGMGKPILTIDSRGSTGGTFKVTLSDADDPSLRQALSGKLQFEIGHTRIVHNTGDNGVDVPVGILYGHEERGHPRVTLHLESPGRAKAHAELKNKPGGARPQTPTPTAVSDPPEARSLADCNTLDLCRDGRRLIGIANCCEAGSPRGNRQIELTFELADDAGDTSVAGKAK
jgi:hypothetical protein